jgi:hypothetical protein
MIPNLGTPPPPASELRKPPELDLHAEFEAWTRLPANAEMFGNLDRFTPEDLTDRGFTELIGLYRHGWTQICFEAFCAGISTRAHDQPRRESIHGPRAAQCGPRLLESRGRAFYTIQIRTR